MKMVQIGMRGKAVVALQQALVDQGYELDVDGDFGERTLRVLRVRHGVTQLRFSSGELGGVVGVPLE